jgi:hypothetical protein
MFAKFAVQLLSVSLLASLVSSTPVTRNILPRTSLNNWGGHAQMSNFDDFNGADNFDGSHSSQVAVAQQEQVVCHSQQIEIVQQRLVVLQEMAKRIITEQICEVEVQTIVFEQFYSSMGHFHEDLHRSSGKYVGYDHQIASHYGDLANSDGSLKTSDMGFKGYNVGSNYVVVGGSNWDSSYSPSSVQSAYEAAHSAM